MRTVSLHHIHLLLDSMLKVLTHFAFVLIVPEMFANFVLGQHLILEITFFSKLELEIAETAILEFRSSRGHAARVSAGRPRRH